MDWAVHQPRVRLDLRLEREEYERLFKHPARVLQDRLVRLGGCDRTSQHGLPEWELVYQRAAGARRLLHQARVLSWGTEKTYYYTHKIA